MRIRYTVPFKGEVIIEDHWPIPVMDGVCRVVEEQGHARALEVTFSGQSVEHAPQVEELPTGPVKIHITDRDQIGSFLKLQIDSAIAYLGCLFDVSLSTDEIGAHFEAETPDEEKHIPIRSMTTEIRRPPVRLPFDVLTRALMAAEGSNGPRFTATLVSAARRALFEQQYIDSFRYSFLLIEALYGAGQFKADRLKEALRADATFGAIVTEALADQIKPRPEHRSDTMSLLLTHPTADALIDHLVEKRGFYFHANVKRRDAWRPEDQRAAEALALLSIAIASAIGADAASLVFGSDFEERHYRDASAVGAMIVFKVKLQYREPGEALQRDGMLTIRTPGTKMTGKLARYVALKSLEQFEHDAPLATLVSAECKTEEGDKVFTLAFYL